MPRIKIIKKGLPKALAGMGVMLPTTQTTVDPLGGISITTNSQTTTTTTSAAGYQQPFTQPTNVLSGVATPAVDIWNIGRNNQMPPNPYAGVKQFKMDSNQSPVQKNTAAAEAVVTPTTTIPVSKFNKFATGLHNVTEGIDKFATIAGAALNYFDTQKKQREFDKWMAQSMLPHNYYAVDTRTNRGDYDVNEGMFDPYRMGYKSKGTQANPIGAMSAFTKYGGMIKAKDGILVPGDEILQDAFLPDVSTNIIGPAAAPVSSQAATPSFSNYSNVPDFSGSIKDVIAQKESGGNYKALPRKKDGTLASSAVGKYQFLWNQNKDWISRVTGVTTKEDFRNNPQAQEAAFDYWDKNILTPTAQKIKNELGIKLPMNNIKYAIHFAGPGGAYKYFSTGKETVDAFGSTIAKYAGIKTSEEGGEHINNSNMKIRIVGGPKQMKAGGQSDTTEDPKYSGQSDYGLYIGQRNLYNTMAKNPYTDSNDTVGEKEESQEDPHVLEAEGGETILRPDGTHMNIVGDRHTDGGVKLTKSQAPEGSFIYSDTKRMRIKNPKILAHFGKSSKKAITPAQIAKQYDVNKYMGILQDPYADNLSKDTAMRMVENYQRKLAELALVQESIKGFPQGMPEVAKSVLGETGMGKQSVAAYGGYFAPGGEMGPGDGMPLPPKPGMPVVDNNGRPIGASFNINNALGENPGTYGISGGWDANVGKNKLENSAYNLAIKFPQLFGKGYGMGVKGSYGDNTLDIGANAKFRTGKRGALTLTGGYSQNFGNQQTPAGEFDDFRMPAAPAQPKRNFNVGANWEGKIKGTNIKISGFYGKPQMSEGGSSYFIENEDPNAQDKFGIRKYLKNAGALNTSTGKPISTPIPLKDATYTDYQPIPSWFKPWVSSYTKAGRTSPTGEPTVFDPKDPNKFYVDYNRWKKLNNGKDFSGPEEFQNFVYDYVNSKDPKAIEEMWKHWGTTNLGKKYPKDLRKAFADKYFGARTAKIMGWEPPTVPPAKTETPPAKTETPPAETPTTKKEDTAIKKLEVPGGDPTASKMGKAAWTSQNIRDLLNAGWDYATLKKYHPYTPTVQPVLPEFIPTDWRGYASALQSGAAKTAEQLGTYQPGQSLAANKSFLAGQQGQQLADYISKVDQYNAAGATQADAQRADTLNKFALMNAENRARNFAEENIYDDRYRTAERLARKGVVKAWDTGEDVASKIYNLNQVESPYYKINPYTQQLVFNSPEAKAAYEASIRGGAPSDADEIAFQRIEKAKKSPAFAGYSDAKEQMDAILRFYGYGSGTPKNKTVVTSNNPYTQGKTVTTNYNQDDEETTPTQTGKYGGSIGVDFTKTVADWYNKLDHIEDPNERQRLAEAYARKIHFGK